MIYLYGGIGGSTQRISPPTHHRDFCFSSGQAAALPPTPRRRHRITVSLPSPRRITASPRFPLVLPAGGGAGRAAPEPPARSLDPLSAGANNCRQEGVAISGLLDGTGEYTLLYEDYEGDRVLVGDVPWGK
uniref:Auxin-responsive protein n=1 Tax=Oryza glumipatula TaxID=40148 RepID=A0A0D9ZEM7_9ORYZ